MSIDIDNRPISSAQHLARTAGFFYLVTIVARMAAETLVRHKVVVTGDAATTAARMLSNPSLVRAGFIFDMISFASYVLVAAALYSLLRPVSRAWSLAAAFVALVSATVQAFSSAFQLAALAVVDRPEYLNVFTAEQSQALAFLLMRVRAIAYHNVGLVFLGLYCLVLGVLLFRSRFIPRTVSVLVAIAGFVYLAFLSPAIARLFLPHLLMPAAVGQIALTLWLLIFGINKERWQASVASNGTNAAV